MCHPTSHPVPDNTHKHMIHKPVSPAVLLLGCRNGNHPETHINMSSSRRHLTRRHLTIEKEDLGSDGVTRRLRTAARDSRPPGHSSFCVSASIPHSSARRA